MTGKVAIITGACDGRSLANARLFAAEGAKVVAIEHFGKIDLLVNDVSLPGNSSKWENTSIDSVKDLSGINFLAHFRSIQLVFAHFKHQGGQSQAACYR